MSAFMVELRSIKNNNASSMYRNITDLYDCLNG
jgi:hypothetical protein